MSAYAAYAGVDYDVWLSGYDDSLSFADHRPAGLECLWLDCSRYALDAAAFVDWLADRLSQLRRRSPAPIVVATWADPMLIAHLQQRAGQLASVYVADLTALAESARVALLDARNAAVAGTSLSRPLITLAARALACRWWAGALLTPIKAIALDLDHTLHAGVLAESGTAGVRLTPGHARLQKLLLDLRAHGILLALISRNEAADVQQLFALRTDYPLRLQHFSAVEVSWGSKSEALARIAKRLNIGLEAILLVDDNPGELYEVAARCPTVHLLQAQDEADDTCRALENYPGLWRWRISREDELRARDLAAQSHRAKLQAQAEPGAYFRALGVRIGLTYNPGAALERLASLSMRTNQFNLALRRLTAAEIQGYMQAEKADVAAVSLADRLSDSGIVGLIIGRRREDTLVIEELCLSCRSLGRGLEDALVLPAIAAMPCASECAWLEFSLVYGPRNEPARQWLARITGSPTPPVQGRIRLPFAVAADYAVPDGVNLCREGADG
ncbi:MAG: HAD-IIIC family phosphatase [Thiobacillaceae bacterium]|nr:HAD-IIIC family phosphatase [Thiobacillaceae bacterium]MDW8324739.1 HAD-IIIC family phosphatase [Burkholderiales bacterium]